MQKMVVPLNVGKVRVAMGVAGTYAVWNGKQGKHEFKILVRTRQQAEQIATIINSRQHPGWIEVLDGGRR